MGVPMADVWQKTPKFYKAITLQLKIEKRIESNINTFLKINSLGGEGKWKYKLYAKQEREMCNSGLFTQ